MKRVSSYAKCIRLLSILISCPYIDAAYTISPPSLFLQILHRLDLLHNPRRTPHHDAPIRNTLRHNRASRHRDALPDRHTRENNNMTPNPAIIPVRTHSAQHTSLSEPPEHEKTKTKKETTHPITTGLPYSISSLLLHTSVSCVAAKILTFGPNMTLSPIVTRLQSRIVRLKLAYTLLPREMLHP